jgi:Zn-dependent protease
MALTGGRFNNPTVWLTNTLQVLPGIILGLTCHEFAHAFAAHKLGDYTPKIQGRVSLNPIRHIDPIGLICIIFVGFGWGKPVMVNPANLNKLRRDEIIVSLAGVVTNFILAILLTIVLSIFWRMIVANIITAGAAVSTTLSVLLSAIRINLVLMVFNLLPVPPLDGFNFLSSLLGIKHTEIYYKMYQYGMWILMALILFGIVGTIIGFTVVPMFNTLMSFAVR